MFRPRHPLASASLFRFWRSGPLLPRLSLRHRCHLERSEGSASLCPAFPAPAAFQSFKSADVQLCRLSERALSLLCKNTEKLTPLFSIFSALFKRECFADSFRINDFRTLLQNTGGVHRQPRLLSWLSPSCNSFIINTCRTVSKQSPLTIFRINTYEKHRGRGALHK
jgi:hypothetical protein